MKRILLLCILLISLSAEDIDKNPHELFLTSYLYSMHFTKQDNTGKEFTGTHKAYGLEYIYLNDYSLTYNHFINSRGRDVDLISAGYLFNFNESFGLHLTGGYQKGYCFDGVLSSVECQPGANDKSAFILPLLFYKHKYFKVDFFTNSDMIAFRFNIKIYDLF